MAKIKRPKPHPKFGATKKQGEANARSREIKNRLFALERAVEELRDQVSGLIGDKRNFVTVAK